MIYILHGDDEFALADFVNQKLIAPLGSREQVELNLTRLEGRAVTPAAVRGACMAMPFLSARRVVLATDYLKQFNEREIAVRRDVADLLAFLPQVPASTALAFVDRSPLGKNPVLKWAQGAGSLAHVQQFSLPGPKDLPQWIAQRAKAAGGQFTGAAAAALAAAVGDQPMLAKGEIDKLLTYVDFARPVEPGDVAQLLPSGGQAKVFALVDALGLGDRKTALHELHRMFEGRDKMQAYYSTFGMIVRQFRLLLLAREVLEGGGRAGDVAAKLALHPYPAEKISQQARHFSLAALERIYRKLLETDEQVKTGQSETATALELLVVNLTAREGS